MEFANACSDLGFGAGANEIFRTLDKDGSGTVSQEEWASVGDLRRQKEIEEEDRVRRASVGGLLTLKEAEDGKEAETAPTTARTDA